MNELFDLVQKYGTDKTLSGYTYTYSDIFTPIKNKVKSILEIGLGTQLPEIPSSFVGNKNLFDHYKPGGSLRVWRDFFPNSQVYGVDIAKDCMFKEERIETFLFDSSEKNYTDYYLNDLEFDIIIDDGNHDPKYQVKTLQNLFPKLKDGGYYIIEDIGGYSGTEELMVDYLEEFNSVTNEYIVTNKGNHIVIYKKKHSKFDKNKDLTIVTGLWNIGREGRPFTHYLDRLNEFLAIDANMFLYIPQELEKIVWENRSPHNTFVKIYELEDIKKIYSPFWDKTQEIRNKPEWRSLAGWLGGSPQAQLEWYNPIVQSKMFLLNDVTIWNPFNTNHFIWLDAGITNTVHDKLFTESKALDKIIPLLNDFLFLSYPYEANTEIHGFEFQAINRFAGQKVEWVCRGGLFGGSKAAINQASALYYGLLSNTLAQGYMGTEESIFAIMSYLEPEKYRRYSLDGNGLISKFIHALLEDKATLEPIPQSRLYLAQKPMRSINDIKVSVYMLTFNFPHQVEHTIKTWLEHPKWLKDTRNILIDNSTNQEARDKNAELCKTYGFEHIITGENLGINRGRLLAAEHFQASDSDYYLFLEDDMGAHAPNTPGSCRNGFRLGVDNLYDKVIKIMESSDADYLKLSYTEVYMDNNIQVSWYNVPQHVRSEVWPKYDKLPVTGLDPRCPRTKWDTIEVVDGVSYAKGEAYYANWPLVMGKVGNQKVFLDVKWANPYEQTQMSYVFQETIKGNIKPAVLLASPINHNRIAHYTAEERREN
jgi:hypothetical protein